MSGTPTKEKRPSSGANGTPSKRRSPHFAADAKGSFGPVLDPEAPPHTLLLGTQPSDTSCARGAF